MTLTIKSVENGSIVVADPDAGHEITFKLATAKGAQVLDEMAPHWSGGQEPTSAKKFLLEARQLAEGEAVDQGWISL